LRVSMKILITGATAGIGLSCVESFCRDGHSVIGIARGADKLRDLEARLGTFRGIACDIADEDSVAAMAAELGAVTGDGTLDVLINNAGYGAAGPVEQVSLRDWKAQYGVNVFGTIAVTQAALPLLRKSERARIVNVSSVAGRVYAPFFAPYYSTKHALECVSDALRLELEEQGIAVVIVEPGAVRTGFANHEDEMLERCADESDLYREPIRKTIEWHKGIVEQGITADQVVETIREAVLADRPRHRYVVPRFPSQAFIALANFLPSKLADAAIRKIIGLA